MKRREILACLAGAAAWPLSVQAQQAGRMYRFGFVTPQPRTTFQYVALFEGLAKLGFVDGRNLWVDDKGFNLKPDRSRHKP